MCEGFFMPINEQANRTSNEAWIQDRFVERSPIRNGDGFNAIAQERQQHIENLPPELQELRTAVRKEFNVADDGIWCYLGEQPCGLNEPPLVLGKRLLGKHMESTQGWTLLEYLAVSDVIGSETGMYRFDVPCQVNASGIETISLLPEKPFRQTPANLIASQRAEVDDTFRRLISIYRENPQVYELMGKMYSEYQIKNNTYADAQNALFQYLQSKLGLRMRKRVNDIDIDSLIAQKGGLEYMITNWDEIVTRSAAHTNAGTRVPDMEEAPFFAYPSKKYNSKDDGDGGEINDKPPVRPRIWFADDSRTRFVATHPFDKKETVGEFSLDDILRGKVGITFRAIPRAFLMNAIVDAHISGGGAQYNEVVKRTFEQMYNVPYLPIAFMDLVGQNGNRQSVFGYDSSVLQRNKKAQGYPTAFRLVEEGSVSMMDLMLSVPDGSWEKVQSVINDKSFDFSARVDLR